MSVGCQGRSILWQEIQNGLQFLQSTLPFPGNQDQYEVFIQDLVKNLFEEGNYAFQECNLTKSTEMYTEALSIAEYADSEDISVPTGLLGKLHANRAAAYLKAVPGLYEQALEDCEKALQLNEENYRAWYRKAKSLKEMGRHQDAYEAIAKCSLAVPQDPHVIQLTQDLAKMLGLKIRKAYIRSKPASNVLQGSYNSSTSGDQLSQGSPSVEDIETESPRFTQESSGSGPVTARGPMTDTEVHTLPNNTCVVEATHNFDIPSVSPNHVERPEFTPVPATPVPVSVAMPLLPQFVNGVRSGESYPVLELQLDYDAEIIGDDLDDLLDQAAPSDSSLVIPTMNRPISLPNIVLDSTVDMPSIISQFMKQTCTVNLPHPFHKPESSGYPSSHDSFDTTLDSLDSLSISGSQTGYGKHSFIQQFNNDKPLGMAVGMPDRLIPLSSVDLAQNPLAETHEFKQACSFCFLKNGPGVMNYTLHIKDHMCKKDALLGRIKHLPDQSWKLIRPRPTKNQYVGPYYICKEVAVGEECLYPGHCTFAYCQEEIDVWTMERKGFISRDLLFDPFGANCKVNMTVSNILQEHHGIFMFLCGVCFDHKPRIISKPNKDSPSLCSHPVTKHDFEKHRCLVHILKDKTMRYSKIRPCSPECQLDLCRHEVRYGCVREDDCLFAHSLIELKVWMLQHERGSTHEIIAKEAKKFWSIETSWLSTQQLPTIQRSFGPQNLKMLFVCGQCWRNGQLSEADKTKKYCTAKARHAWSKERRVVLVSSNERKKWTTVRSVPTKKPLPSQFDVCIHITAGKKCQYIGNCSFAHSTEERDLWTYMKDNNILDMEQLYDEWLQSQKPGWSKQTSSTATRENGKQIHMPTDYAEEVAGSHCWLCGKNCNSDKQWQQHITSEKHKEKVFNSEEDQNCWQYRFPTGTFKVCERYLVGTCSIPCKMAHGDDELKEWIERREFLLMKLAKARKDHLIAPNDNDFGKYSFLLKDIK